MPSPNELCCHESVASEHMGRSQKTNEETRDVDGVGDNGPSVLYWSMSLVFKNRHLPCSLFSVPLQRKSVLY